MKTRIATLTLLLGMFISATALAGNPPVPASKAVASSVANYIEDELEYPEFAIEQKFEGDVVMELIIEDDGTFDVKAANSVSDQMKEYLVEAVENIEPTDFSRYAGQSLLVKVTYDLKLY